jgi:hypothetical protein
MNLLPFVYCKTTTFLHCKKMVALMAMPCKSQGWQAFFVPLFIIISEIFMMDLFFGQGFKVVKGYF